MGAGQSYPLPDRTSLIRGLGHSIRDFMRPTREQLVEAWASQGKGKEGLLSQAEVLSVITNLLDMQIKAAQEEASRMKMDMARQQAKMERDARNTKSEVMYAVQAGNIGQVSRDALNRATALSLGSSAGPVMAGMMAGYVDIPVTCLTKLKADGEFLEARAALIMHHAGNANELISLEHFTMQYLEFFDSAPRLLGEEKTAKTAGEGSPQGEGSECAVQ
mmetsp:Transcript_23908/g.71417  ORF Transcript_23908/g.71417 Transcript_23908/m.71417 type:complete len:219 (-) Transcript_23908:31-687(-)|eukprot:CAMPEP_0175229184 /NCGR_PEP_ID=MMETSP0093-20121207/24300_1 /TAXON_ID=311494 /ORGANISM="Alexandrium monilatum, Strain CCMP3105" /LENGTH=218 /DNA_ID=CAMNT_0016522977 /DNA_START=91 /DNA_END=747 /DNA_ORIENTATION=+